MSPAGVVRAACARPGLWRPVLAIGVGALVLEVLLVIVWVL